MPLKKKVAQTLVCVFYLSFFDNHSTILFGGNANRVIATATIKKTKSSAANAITSG